jgi:hypothetical protein
MKMSNCDYQDFIYSRLVNDAVREPVSLAPSDTLVDLLPAERMPLYSIDRRLYLRSQLVPKSLTLGVVPARSFAEFRSRSNRVSNLHESSDSE